MIYAAFGNVPVVEAIFFGIKAAVLVIVIEALAAHRQACLEAPRALDHCGAVVRRHFLSRRAIPADCVCGGAIRLSSRDGNRRNPIKAPLSRRSSRQRRPFAPSAIWLRHLVCCRCLRSPLFSAATTCFHADEPVFFQARGRHLWRRLCRARLHGSGCRHSLRLARCGRDDGWAWARGDDAWVLLSW